MRKRKYGSEPGNSIIAGNLQGTNRNFIIILDCGGGGGGGGVRVVVTDVRRSSK